jgi:hypothetical protein
MGWLEEDEDPELEDLEFDGDLNDAVESLFDSAEECAICGGMTTEPQYVIDRWLGEEQRVCPDCARALEEEDL